MNEIKRYFRPDRGFENVEQLNGYIFSPEAQAHTFIISKLVLVDGVETPAEFQSTATVSCRFLKHNQVTELVEGSIESGKAVVTLPAECYAVPGRFTMTILLTKNSSVTCIYAATGSVLDADSENVNVSQNTVRNVDEKIAEINSASATAQAAVSQVQTAVAGVPAVIASIPQDYTALSNSVGDLMSAVSEKPGNWFCLAPGNEPTFYTTGFKGITLKKYPDGSIEINGTSDSANALVGETVTETVTASTPWLPADTYSFGLEIISGTSTADKSSNDFSVRAGVTNTVVLSKSVLKTENQQYNDTAMCFLRFGAGTVYDHFRVKIMINSGETLLPYVPHQTAYDYSARDLARNVNEKYSALQNLLEMPQIPVKLFAATNRGQGGTLIGDLYVFFRYSSGSGNVAWNSIDLTQKTETKGNVSAPSGTTAYAVMGHCNDVAYNPNTSKIYVATLIDDKPIAELSVTITNGVPTFAFVQNITITDNNDIPIIPSGIAYDRTNSCYYVMDMDNDSENGGNIYKYNTNWEYVETIELPSTVTRAARQGIDTDGTYLYFARTDGSTTAPVPHVMKFKLALSSGETADNRFVGERNLYLLQDLEIEGVAFDWQRGVFISNMNVKPPFPQGSIIYVVDPDGTQEHITSKLSYLM